MSNYVEICSVDPKCSWSNPPDDRDAIRAHVHEVHPEVEYPIKEAVRRGRLYRIDLYRTYRVVE